MNIKMNIKIQEICPSKNCDPNYIKAIKLNTKRNSIYIVDTKCGFIHQLPLSESKIPLLDNHAILRYTFPEPTNMAFAKPDLLLVAEGEKQITVFSEKQSQILQRILLTAWPLAIATLPNNHLLVLGSEGGDSAWYYLQRLALGGRKLFEYPILGANCFCPGIAVNAKGVIYLALGLFGKYLLIKFNQEGIPLYTYDRKLSPHIIGQPDELIELTSDGKWVKRKNSTIGGTVTTCDLCIDPYSQNIFTIFQHRYIEMYDSLLNFNGLIEIPFNDRFSGLAVSGKMIYLISTSRLFILEYDSSDIIQNPLKAGLKDYCVLFENYANTQSR